jgi:hypothetical protein
MIPEAKVNGVRPSKIGLAVSVETRLSGSETRRPPVTPRSDQRVEGLPTPAIPRCDNMVGSRLGQSLGDIANK